MSIPLVKPATWAEDERMSRTQIDQIDKNQTYRLDKRTLQTDTISSDLYFDTDSGLTITEDGYVNVQNIITGTTKFNTYIDFGVLATDAEISGKTKPLRHGYKEITLPSSGTYNMPVYFPSTYQTLSFTGLIRSSITVIFPIAIGYTMLINGDFTTFHGTNSYIILSLGSGDGYITMFPNETKLIYCDGSNLVEIAGKSTEWQMVDKISMSVGMSRRALGWNSIKSTFAEHTMLSFPYAGSILLLVKTVEPDVKYGTLATNPLYLTSPGAGVFMDVKKGDIFEVKIKSKIQGLATNNYTSLTPIVEIKNNQVTQQQSQDGFQHNIYITMPECSNVVLGSDYSTQSFVTTFTAELAATNLN